MNSANLNVFEGILGCHKAANGRAAEPFVAASWVVIRKPKSLGDKKLFRGHLFNDILAWNFPRHRCRWIPRPSIG